MNPFPGGLPPPPKVPRTLDSGQSSKPPGTSDKPARLDRKRQEIGDELVHQATTGSRTKIPHLGELVEALFDRPGGVRAFAQDINDEYMAAKSGSLQRTKLIEAKIRLLEAAEKRGHGGDDNLGLLTDEDLLRMAKSLLSSVQPQAGEAE